LPNRKRICSFSFERRPLFFSNLNQFSHREIAAFLELTVSTVKFRLHDGRKRLKKELIRMARKNLKANRPSRDDQFATRTVEVISALNPYQIAKLMVGTDQNDLIALLQSAEEVRELILGRVSPHIRTFLEEEMKRRKIEPDDIRKAQEKVLKTASKLPKAPPKPGKAFLAMKKKLEEKLEAHDVVEVGCEELPAIFSSMAEIARLEGILSLEILAGARDPFFTTGLRLLLDGTEPGVIAEVQNPWKETILAYFRTRYEMIETGLTEISGGRHPMLIAHKLATIYRAELEGPLGGTAVGEKDCTAGKFKTRVKRTPFSVMNLDQLTEALVVLAWIARKRGFDELDKVVDCIDEEFAQTGLRWLLEGTEGDKMFRLAPEITLEMVATRKEALVRKRDLCYSMVVDGLVSLQRGMHPKLLEFKLRNYFE
jgi:flagellar motor component MotA